MGTVYSIRGTNGSGKTTLARKFLPPNLHGDTRGGPVDLNFYLAPTKRDPDRMLRGEGYMYPGLPGVGDIGVIGRYDSACGGMDRMPSFEVCQGAILHMLHALKVRHVIAEGLLASGTYGSWGTFAATCRDEGHGFAFVYLQTPYEVCVERIKARQAAAGNTNKVIKWELVKDKYNQVVSNRLRALEHGELVYDLPFLKEEQAMLEIMAGEGEQYRAG